MSICFLWRNSERMEKNPPKKQLDPVLYLIWDSPPTQPPQSFTTEPTLNNIGEGNKHIRRNVAGETLCRHSAFSWPQLLPARRRNLLMGLDALHLAGCLWMTPTYSGGKEKTGTQSKVWTREHDLTAKAQVTTAQGMTRRFTSHLQMIKHSKVNTHRKTQAQVKTRS